MINDGEQVEMMKMSIEMNKSLDDTLLRMLINILLFFDLKVLFFISSQNVLSDLFSVRND